MRGLKFLGKKRVKKKKKTHVGFLYWVKVVVDQ